MTRSWVVDLILDLVGYTPNKDLSFSCCCGAKFWARRLPHPNGKATRGSLGASIGPECLFEPSDHAIEMILASLTPEQGGMGIALAPQCFESAFTGVHG